MTCTLEVPQLAPPATTPLLAAPQPLTDRSRVEPTTTEVPAGDPVHDCPVCFNQLEHSGSRVCRVCAVKSGQCREFAMMGGCWVPYGQRERPSQLTHPAEQRWPRC